MTREEAIYTLEQMKTWSKDLSDDEIEALVIALKALEQEPKTGHWIYIVNSGVNGLKICKCSNCEKKTYGSPKFCPNCGARMEGEDK